MAAETVFDTIKKCPQEVSSHFIVGGWDDRFGCQIYVMYNKRLHKIKRGFAAIGSDSDYAKEHIRNKSGLLSDDGIKVAFEDAEHIAKGAVFNAIENDKSSGFEVRSYLASLQCSLVVGEQVRQETEIESSSLATQKIWDTCSSASNDRDPDIELDLESGVDQCIVVW